ncbi:MAG: hypothetical protein CM1200mP10_01860 [Candidatus Neomarinimicrobiota bacterium]|nr:MAG: hypothetical protein CM1200mP10_01860 [Candidatus Neomarinimicrobiota bacterium]
MRLSARVLVITKPCPYKYRLKHIDKVPERKTRVTMEFGIIIHNVLDELHGNEDQSLDNILQLLEKHWRTEAFEYLLREEEFKIQARELSPLPISIFKLSPSSSGPGTKIQFYH